MKRQSGKSGKSGKSGFAQSNLARNAARAAARDERRRARDTWLTNYPLTKLNYLWSMCAPVLVPKHIPAPDVSVRRRGHHCHGGCLCHGHLCHGVCATVTDHCRGGGRLPGHQCHGRAFTDAVTVIIVMAVVVAVITVMARAAVVTAELAWHMFGVQVNRIWGKRSLASLGEGKIRVRDRWLILRTSWAQVHKRFVIACVEGLPTLVAFVCLDSIS